MTRAGHPIVAEIARVLSISDPKSHAGFRLNLECAMQRRLFVWELLSACLNHVQMHSYAQRDH